MNSCKKLISFILIFAALHGIASSQSASRTFVKTHDRVTINTDVSQGIKSFPAWGEFPSAGSDIRKIMMHVTLGHPDTMDIAHWDYLDFIFLRRTGGVTGDVKDIEIGRMITPYGSSFKDDWSFTWEVEVTDFSMLLRDSVEIDYMHSGYEPETLGWALTIEFEILHGPPAANPVSVTEIYNGSFPYGRPDDPIENHLKPFEFEFDDSADFGHIRIQHTGHGADRPRMCSEFCNRWREVLFNNTLVDRRDLWKDCGSNPLYPQGGTWIFDRGHWCPGDLQSPDIIRIDAGSGVNTIEFLMEPYVAEDNIQAREVIGAYLIQYEKPNHKHDIALEKVIVPGNNDMFSRKNPACFNPVIEFKNLGSEPLEKLTIIYGTRGFDTREYTWEGHLSPNQSEILFLPGEIDFERDLNTFEVKLLRPNGRKDAWTIDNTGTSEFYAPKELPLNFIIQYKTNNIPEDNHIFLINSDRDTVYQRTPEQSVPNEVYSDTLNLSPGKFEFFLTDESGDGLEFWARPGNGYGYLRFIDLDSGILHNFISDCGNGQFLAFNAVSEPENDTTVSQNAFFLYPRRTAKNIELDAFLPFHSKLQVKFLKDGDVFASHEYMNFKQGTIMFDIGHLEPGRYIVEIYVDGNLAHRNRINRDRE